MLRHRLVLGTARAGADGVVARCERAWLTWLTFKELGDSRLRQQWTAEPGLHTIDEYRWQTRTATPTSARWRLTEDLSSGRWTSTLTAVEVPLPARPGAGIAGWVELIVESEGAESEDEDGLPPAFRPRIHRYLMSMDGWVDGPAPLTGVERVDRKGVPLLVQTLIDPRRHLPAFVLSAPSGRQHEWESIAESLASQARGVGSVWMLERDATDTLQERLGKDLSVWGGAARTYLPRVRPHDPSEAGYTSRHRVVSWDKLSDHTDYFVRLLTYRASELATRLATPTPPPPGLDVIPVASRHLTQLKTDSAAIPLSPVVEVPKTTEAHETAAHDADVAHRMQELQENLESARRALLDMQVEYRTALALGSAAEQEKSAALAQARQVALENADLADEIVSAQELIRGLRQALRYTEDPIAAEQDTVWTDPGALYPSPDTFADFLDLLSGDVEGVIFTGDHKPALALDRHANKRAWLTKAWDAALAMADYAAAVRAGAFAGLFTQWCDGGAPAGRRTLPVGPGRAVVPTESTTVKNDKDMARQRLLPVPTNFDADGEAYMWAHVRIGGGGADAPRMHYLEHKAGVFIGFLGQHLENTRTN